MQQQLGSPALLGFICCKLYSHESMHAVSHVSDLQQKKCAPLNDTHLSPKLETLLGILRTFEHKVYIQGKSLDLISSKVRYDCVAQRPLSLSLQRPIDKSSNDGQFTKRGTSNHPTSVH